MPLSIELKNDKELLATDTVAGKEYIKAPIARLGKWKHEAYGRVEFSQKDFDDITTNWKNNAAGFEPPLYLGHPRNDKAWSGAPAVGFLENVVQEGDTLFGLYEPVDKEAFEEVKKGQYRYASSEVYRNAKDKETGAVIGTLLTAHALTNEPYLTKLPRVEVTEKLEFSNPINTTRFVFSQESATCTKEVVTINAMTQTTEVTSEKDTAAHEQFVQLQHENETLRLELSDKNKQLADLQDAVAAIKQELSIHTERAKKQELSDKLARLNKLNVSAATKEKYSQLFAEGTLDATGEENIFSLLEELSAGNVQKFTDVQGVQEKSEETAVENPYSETILKLAERAKELGREFVI
jgi:hypothetical protein